LAFLPKELSGSATAACLATMQSSHLSCATSNENGTGLQLSASVYAILDPTLLDVKRVFLYSSHHRPIWGNRSRFAKVDRNALQLVTILYI